MTCEVYEDLIPVYVDGELDRQNAELVEAHINQCESCKDAYQQAARFREDISSALRMHQFKIDVVSAVVEQIQPKHSRTSAWVWIPAAAVLVLAVCLFAGLQLAPSKTASPGTLSGKHNPIPAPHINIAKADQVSNPTKHMERPIQLQSAPKHISKQPVLQILKAKQTVAIITAPAGSGQAQIIMKYTDNDRSDPQNDNQYPLAPEALPVPSPGQKIVAENEIVSISGRRLQRVCYRIIEDTDSEIRMEESHDNN